MPKKPTSEQIQNQKEYIRFLNAKIYKLTKQEKYLQNQLTRTQTRIKDLEKEKKELEQSLDGFV
jgi:predicted  nucleic acid-binding Zn-ribbon protein